jgi:hypothetical protein
MSDASINLPIDEDTFGAIKCLVEHRENAAWRLTPSIKATDAETGMDVESIAFRSSFTNKAGDHFYLVFINGGKE